MRQKTYEHAHNAAIDWPRPPQRISTVITTIVMVDNEVRSCVCLVLGTNMLDLRLKDQHTMLFALWLC
jgi:hypothetical protein